jgi:hypothetical protein
MSWRVGALAKSFNTKRRNAIKTTEDIILSMI